MYQVLDYYKRLYELGLSMSSREMEKEKMEAQLQKEKLDAEPEAAIPADLRHPPLFAAARDQAIIDSGRTISREYINDVKRATGDVIDQWRTEVI